MKPIKVDDEIRLKPISFDSAQIIFNSIQISRNHLQPWLPFVDQTRSVNDTQYFIKSVLNTRCMKKDMIFEIWYNQIFAGLIALKEVDHANSKTELGYWLDISKTGRGIMVRSCRAVINYAFNKLNLNRVTVKVAIGNEKSVAIPISLNFYQEGVERHGEMVNGEFRDLIVYSMLRKDWTE